MHKIEYDVTLNDKNRPCIDLPDDYSDKSEDKFFAIEITRYLLQSVYDKRIDGLDVDTLDNIEHCMNLLGQISDEMAMILWDDMKNKGDLSLLINNTHHIKVNMKEDLNEIPEKYICYNNKIYENRDGIKVLVEEDMNIYMFINNEWKIS